MPPRVEDICAQEPHISVVLAGGNPMPWHHRVDAKSDQALVGAKYLAKVIYVGAAPPPTRKSSADGGRWQKSSFEAPFSTVLQLDHGASVIDLKGRFDAPFMTCRDADGRVLEDKETLPAASATACANFGYHAEIFIDCVSALVQQRAQKIHASPEATAAFVDAPRVLGDWSVVHPKGAVKAYEAMGAEIAERLQKVAKPLPADLQREPLEKTKTRFGEVGGSKLSQLFRDCASEVSEKILRCAERALYRKREMSSWGSSTENWEAERDPKETCSTHALAAVSEKTPRRAKRALHHP